MKNSANQENENSGQLTARFILRQSPLQTEEKQEYKKTYLALIFLAHMTPLLLNIHHMDCFVGVIVRAK